MTRQVHVDPALVDALKQQLSLEALLQLTLTIAPANFTSRVNEARTARSISTKLLSGADLSWLVGIVVAGGYTQSSAGVSCPLPSHDR
jgi:hypothetical protein